MAERGVLLGRVFAMPFDHDEVFNVELIPGCSAVVARALPTIIFFSQFYATIDYFKLLHGLIVTGFLGSKPSIFFGKNVLCL